MLVSTQWLEEHLDDVRLVDIRGHVFDRVQESANTLSHYEDYLERHIPGTVFVNWVNDLSDSPQQLMIAEPHDFAALLSRIGIGPDTFVVAYDDAGMGLAARLWWALNYYGHPNVAVLDGGWLKWLAESRPTTADIPVVDSTQFVPRINKELRRTREEILLSLYSGVQFLDMRLPEEYAGDLSIARLRGHIPGALNLPANQLYSPNESLRPLEELQAIFADAGVDGTAPELIVYSNFGVDSCLGVMVMHMLGYTNTSLYDGSWYEWGNTENSPVEAGIM